MGNIPRFLITAPNSQSGKTTVTAALLSALSKRGMTPVAFKCGPDYIDPMFHREALKVPSYNLDLFLGGSDVTARLFFDHCEDKDIAVIEGVMGYYDGVGCTDEASSSALAEALGAPAVLVVPARGAALSLAATISGFKSFKPKSHIAGFILNRCSRALYDRMAPELERQSGVAALGFMPEAPECSLESRHLGLITAAEVEDLGQKLDRLGELASECIDITRLLDIAGGAQNIFPPAIVLPSPVGRTPVIAVAMDEAFCFYYADNLELLKRLGARLEFFSPIRDKTLPDGASGLYLGGGYPELYADKLSQNKSMLKSIRGAVLSGLPTIAECGGFMYLHRSLGGFPMAGVIPADAFCKNRLVRFGYCRLSGDGDGMLVGPGQSVAAHEFHYWDTTMEGGDLTAAKPDGRSWRCAVNQSSIYAGFPHLYFYSNIDGAARFVKRTAEYGRND